MAVSIAVLGDRNLEHLTHREIDATLELLPADVDARWLPSPDAASAAAAEGLWVVPGTPYRDDDAVLEAIHRARAAGMPMLGTCGTYKLLPASGPQRVRRRRARAASGSSARRRCP